MSYFNNRLFGRKELSQLTSNPFVEEFQDTDFNPPPPGSGFMITEDGANFMLDETSPNLMITETA